MTCALCHHEYVEPYNRFRLGDVLEQQHEPYVEFITTAESVSLLSLFKIREQGAPPSRWMAETGTWKSGSSLVSFDGSRLIVNSGSTGWDITV